jgi:hypothetical protein
MSSTILVLLTKWYWGDEIEDEMSWACSMHGSCDKCAKFETENLKVIKTLDGRIILK